MGTLASGSIDLKSLKVAGTEPYKYITTIDSNDGIQVHAVNNPGLNYVQINSDGMEIFQTDGGDPAQAISVAKFGNEVRVGSENDSYIKITGTEISGNSNQLEYFSIDSTGGTTDTYIRMGPNTDIGTTGTKTINLSTDTNYADIWNNLPSTNQQFQVRVFYNYKRTYNGNSANYTFKKASIFTKGTTSTGNTYINYTNTNTISITAATPSTSSIGTWTLLSRQVEISYVTSGLAPLYRFGNQVSESGGPYSFLMGKETVANTEYQLAIGQYNKNNTNAIFMIGNGTSAERKNVFEVLKDGTTNISTDLNVNRYLVVKGIIEGRSDIWVSGDVAVGGDLFIGDHVDEVGFIDTTSVNNCSLHYYSGSNDTWTFVSDPNSEGNDRLYLEAGSWVVSYSLNTDLDASGKYVTARLYKHKYGDANTNAGDYGSSRTMVHTSNTASVILQGCIPLKLSENSTVRLQAYQNAASGIKCNITLRAVRIA